MRKEIENLLDCIHIPGKRVGVVFSTTRENRVKEELKALGFDVIEEEKKDDDADNRKGIIAWNDMAFLTRLGKIILLNNEDFFYLATTCEGKEYIEGPSPKELKLFKKFKVFGVVSRYDEIKLFAPQCKYRWQIWCFKWILYCHLKKIYGHDDYLPLSYDETLWLMKFLWQNNRQKSRWF